ncbi:3-oxoacyl-ACP reductase [Streptomyces otsuchiensis]|uniref:3-oxoacyl-ACP reductase n=1 Tax=Streptomyces otsuchiensis TaxID=2681388 RepID=UPI00102FD58C|nr:3-oxoacyl-ACP reductase [Streptomyces otsuchiensis]
MPDRYQRFTAGGPGGLIARRLGLPRPEVLRRHRPGMPVLAGPAELGEAHGGRMGEPLRGLLATLREEAGAPAVPPGGDDAPGPEGREPGGTAPAALVHDATGIRDSTQLRSLYDFFHPRVRRLAPNGRVVVFGTPPEDTGSVAEAAAQRALEGFVRSLGKELRRGGCAQLVLVPPGAEGAAESTLRFLLSARSAYVSGQVIRLSRPGPGSAASGSAASEPVYGGRPLAGRAALVTGASRGIGAAVAAALARDGARVVCVDVPGRAEESRRHARALGGAALEVDVTSPEAPRLIGERLRELHGGVDVVVHNAGVTRDRTLGRMDGGRWDVTLAVNLTAVERITDHLLAGDGPLLRPGGRIVCTSSIAGIAGNAGQTNYATAKAGLIGLTQALASVVAGRGCTANAVAPGFIETSMTATVPLLVREAGRRMNSLRQGGRPEDVAEAVAYLAAPGSAAVNGQVLRVCGQSLLGA